MLVGLMSLVEELGSYISSGGFIMWILLGGTIFLWFGLGYRFVVLKRGSKEPLRQLIARLEHGDTGTVIGFIDSAVITSWGIYRESNRKQLRRYLDDALFPLEEGLNRHRDLVRTIVIIAPLAGLLGTVTGMIEMFDSLGDQTFYSQTGGIANGISQALFTTQFGLVVAVPGMIAGRLLDKREDRMKEEILQIKEYFNTPEMFASLPKKHPRRTADTGLHEENNT